MTILGRSLVNHPVGDLGKLYEEAVATHQAALNRLARGYEADADRRRDLLQLIHIAIWQSLSTFNGRCSLSTWVYRVAHNVAATHILRNRRDSARLVDIEALEAEPGFADGQIEADRRDEVASLLTLVRGLKPLDRQIILLYLEGEPASSVAEVTGLSPGNVATKIHRIKKLLRRQFDEGGAHA